MDPTALHKLNVNSAIEWLDEVIQQHSEEDINLGYKLHAEKTIWAWKLLRKRIENTDAYKPTPGNQYAS